MNLTNAAKSLNIRSKDLMDILQLKKWIYRRAGGRNFVGYQEKFSKGFGRTKSIPCYCQTAQNA